MSWSIESLAPFDMWGVCALRTNSSRTFWCFVVSLLLLLLLSLSSSCGATIECRCCRRPPRGSLRSNEIHSPPLGWLPQTHHPPSSNHLRYYEWHPDRHYCCAIAAAAAHHTPYRNGTTSKGHTRGIPPEPVPEHWIPYPVPDHTPPLVPDCRYDCVCTRCRRFSRRRVASGHGAWYPNQTRSTSTARESWDTPRRSLCRLRLVWLANRCGRRRC